MYIFGSVCYTYKHSKKKLDPRCKKGIFVGYDRSSSAYLVYYSENNKILKHRQIKFINSVGKQTNTEEESHSLRYPKQKWNVPCYMEDYVTKAKDENDQTLINIDYCYKAMYNVPQTPQSHTTGNQRSNPRLYYPHVKLST